MELVTDCEELNSNCHVMEKGWSPGPWIDRQVIWFLIQAFPRVS